MAEEFIQDEFKVQCLERMGAELGKDFYELWQDCVRLHLLWRDFDLLFLADSSNYEVMNEAAPAFFARTRDLFWDALLLQLCRLTDHPGEGNRSKISLRKLPDLVLDVDRPQLANLVKKLEESLRFARAARDNFIAHTDRQRALGLATRDLPGGSPGQVRSAVEAVAEVMNFVDEKSQGNPTAFTMSRVPGDAESLLHVLRAGLATEKQEIARLSI